MAETTTDKISIVSPADLPRRKRMQGVSFPGVDDGGMFAVDYGDVVADFRKQLSDAIEGVSFVVDKDGRIVVEGGGTAGTVEGTSPITNADIDAICGDGQSPARTLNSLLGI